VDITRAELEDLIAAGAKRGARDALLELGLGDEDAPADVREMRWFAAALRKARERAAGAIGNLIVYAVLAGILVLANNGFKLPWKS
jgi:hypothetical protein